MVQTEGDVKPVPHFVIIGTQKGGTSSLYQYVTQHPHVAAAVQKELHYYDIHFAKGMDWYRSQFPLPLPPGMITGESSPYYLFHPHVAKRMKETIPHVKIITLLRNPVERAFSHYQMYKRIGVETLSFEEAIEREEARILPGLQQMMVDPMHFSREHQVYSYLARGLYADQLTRWYKHFDRERILVIKSEDFFSNTAAAYREVRAFLQLSEWEPPQFQPFNQREDQSSMHPHTYQELCSYFRPHNERLYELLGYDLGW